MTRKTGILGGTFDPVHYGHLALAKAAGDICDLDDILLLPAALPPHKQDKKIVDFNDRAAMLEIAVAKLPELSVSTVEQLLPVPSYTIDTLHYLKRQSPADIQFCFISGADTFLDILSWKQYQSILLECDFAVFSRAGESTAKLLGFVQELGFIQKTNTCWQHPESSRKVYHSNTTLPDISSSLVRRRLAAGESVERLIPQEVVRYIREKSLYSF